MRIAYLGSFVAALLVGCATPSERAKAIALDRNALRDARAGELCRYRAVREGSTAGVPEKPLVEDWILRVLSAAAGTARLEVSVLGPPRTPPSPAPREPAFEASFPMTDGVFSAIHVLRLFRRPDLSEKGMSVVLDRDEAVVAGSVRALILVVGGKTRDARELIVTVRGAGSRATCRVVAADDLPVLGLVEAEADETWVTTGPDGELIEHRRRDHLRLTDWHDATDAR